jgi:hypothetical protein
VKSAEEGGVLELLRGWVLKRSVVEVRRPAACKGAAMDRWLIMARTTPAVSATADQADCQQAVGAHLLWAYCRDQADCRQAVVCRQGFVLVASRTGSRRRSLESLRCIEECRAWRRVETHSTAAALLP